MIIKNIPRVRGNDPQSQGDKLLEISLLDGDGDSAKHLYIHKNTDKSCVVCDQHNVLLEGGKPLLANANNGYSRRRRMPATALCEGPAGSEPVWGTPRLALTLAYPLLQVRQLAVLSVMTATPRLALWIIQENTAMLRISNTAIDIEALVTLVPAASRRLWQVLGTGERAGQIGTEIGVLRLKHAYVHEVVLRFQDGEVEGYLPMDLLPAD